MVIMEKQNIKNYAIGIGISAILIIGITALIYRNEIYMWSLGDINSLYQQAEQHYKEKNMRRQEKNTNAWQKSILPSNANTDWAICTFKGKEANKII